MSQLPSLKNIIKAYLYITNEPLSLKRLEHLTGQIADKISQSLKELNDEYQDDELFELKLQDDELFELKHVATGYQLVLRAAYIPWANKLTELKPQKLSRALLETLALIAYRQPVTRADIEEIRGVAVSTQTIKFLIEQDWVKVIGHRDVPGRPSLLATTKRFLDDFSMLSLKDLPTLDLTIDGQKSTIEQEETVNTEPKENE